MNNHCSGYYDYIIDWILFYPIVMVTSHSTVPDSLAPDIQIYGKILGILYTIICDVALHWHSCTHFLPLNLYLVHDGIFRFEVDLVMYTDISGDLIT